MRKWEWREWRVGSGCGYERGCGKRARDYIIAKMTEPRDYLRYDRGTVNLADKEGDSQRGCEVTL